MKITSEIDKDEIQESAKHDICKNADELKQSQTVKRIIHYTAQKTSGFIDLNLLANNGITKTYEKFIKKEPITKQEKNHLLLFFKMDSSHKVAQEVISKLFILIGSKNSEFVRTFLKDKNGQLSDSQFIQHMIYELENYKFIIDIDWTIEKIDSNNFSYTHQWKYGIMHKMNGDFFSSYGYLEPVKILDSHLFFWVRENTMRWHVEKLTTSWGTLPYAYDEKMWIICVCNGTDFEEIYKKPGIIDAQDIWNWYIRITNEQEKKWLIFIQENKSVTHLPPIYEKIANNFGFILTTNKEDENENFTLWVFKESNGIIQEVLTEDCKKDMLDFMFDTKKNPNRISNFMPLQNNYFQVQTKNGINIYRYFEKENMFDLVPGLDWIESISSEHQFFEGEPVTIKFTNGTSWLYVFDSVSSILTCLIKFKNDSYWLEVRRNDDLLEINNLHTQKTQYFLYYDDTIFQLKEWYKHIKDGRQNYGYIKKWFFWKKIPLTTNFDQMQEYFYECNFVINM